MEMKSNLAMVDAPPAPAIDPAAIAAMRQEEAPPEENEIAALERLLEVAKGTGGQSRRVADFLLAWWNAAQAGYFDLTSIWGVDDEIVRDIVVVFGLVARVRAYPDKLGYTHEFHDILIQWRPDIAAEEDDELTRGFKMRAFYLNRNVEQKG
jgi:hypothetical protein